MTKTKDLFMQQRDWEQHQEDEVQLPQTTGLTISQTSFVDLDKDGIRNVAMAVVDRQSDGFNSPTEGLIFAKKLSEVAELIKENLADAAANELKLAKGEKSIQHGVEINEQMTGVKYSFKECGDPLWNELNEKIKAREAFLKTIKGSKEEIIEETGEVVKVFEPVKSGKMSLIIKIK